MEKITFEAYNGCTSSKNVYSSEKHTLDIMLLILSQVIMSKILRMKRNNSIYVSCLINTIAHETSYELSYKVFKSENPDKKDILVLFEKLDNYFHLLVSDSSLDIEEKDIIGEVENKRNRILKNIIYDMLESFGKYDGYDCDSCYDTSDNWTISISKKRHNEIVKKIEEKKVKYNWQSKLKRDDIFKEILDDPLLTDFKYDDE